MSNNFWEQEATIFMNGLLAVGFTNEELAKMSGEELKNTLMQHFKKRIDAIEHRTFTSIFVTIQALIQGIPLGNASNHDDYWTRKALNVTDKLLANGFTQTQIALMSNDEIKQALANYYDAEELNEKAFDSVLCVMGNLINDRHH